MANEKVMKVEKEPELTHEALGIHKNEVTGQFTVVVVKYNLETGAAKVTEKLATGVDRYDANDKYKIESVNRGVIT